MKDKERILTHIVSRIYPKYLFDMNNNYMTKFESSRNIKVGDMVLATTSGIHDFTIGYAEQVLTESNIVVKEIGGKRTCNISNEMFYKIPKDLLSTYELLEGQQYKIYRMVSKALSKLSHAKRFHSIFFDDSKCTVNLRAIFENEVIGSFDFDFSSKTTLKGIMEIVERGLNNAID